jgi:hypothetical protein
MNVRTQHRRWQELFRWVIVLALLIEATGSNCSRSLKIHQNHLPVMGVRRDLQGGPISIVYF